MSRLNYSEDEDYPGQFNIWQANCRRSLRGRKGQAALRELEAALVAMPIKELIADDFVKPSGAVCALGALAVRRKCAAGLTEAQAVEALADPERQAAIDADDFYDEPEMEAIGEQMGLPRLVAWKVVEINDIHCDTVWEKHHGPVRQGFGHYQGGIAHVRPMTPSERYEKMLAWVRSEIVTPPQEDR